MKKIWKMFSALFLGTALAVILCSCAGNAQKESTGEQIDDSAITGRVKSAIHHDTLYKFPGVKVTTFKGSVQLSGFVDESVQKDRAETLAKGAEGVKEVVNNITVK
jgi:hyperosmotically inducible periplasmic protein